MDEQTRLCTPKIKHEGDPEASRTILAMRGAPVCSDSLSPSPNVGGTRRLPGFALFFAIRQGKRSPRIGKDVVFWHDSTSQVAPPSPPTNRPHPRRFDMPRNSTLLTPSVLRVSSRPNTFRGRLGILGPERNLPHLCRPSMDCQRSTSPPSP